MKLWKFPAFWFVVPFWVFLRERCDECNLQHHGAEPFGNLCEKLSIDGIS